MTPVELSERLVGFQEKEKRECQKLAKLGSIITFGLTGTWIKPSLLWPEVFPEPPVYTKEDRQKELDEIKEEVGLN